MSHFPIDFLSLHFLSTLVEKAQVSLLKETIIQSSPMDLKEALNIFLLMSQGTTFQVFNHLYSPKIFRIYGKHLNSVGEKKKPESSKFRVNFYSHYGC